MPAAWALIVDAEVREITGFDPAGRYVPSLLWVDVAPFNPAPGPGWSAVQDGDSWSFAAPTPLVPPIVVPSVTALDFLNLFTDAEQTAVFAAAPQDPALFGFLFKLACAGTVRLADPRVIAGVGLLGSGGLVAPSRPAQVLGNILADAVTFDSASAVELGPVLADAVSFDTSRRFET